MVRKSISKKNNMNKSKMSFTLPKHMLRLLIITVVWNQSVYYAGNAIAKNWVHYNLELSIDSIVPFLPWTLCIYIGCYLFWAVNYVLCAHQENTQAYRFFCADFIAKAICFVFFILLPTTNVRPEIAGNTFWELGITMLYQIDAPTNLFPSIHCLVSWFCFIGIRKNKNISLWYRMLSLFIAVAICFSTLTTRQHIMIDVIGGILLAEISYWIAGFPAILNKYTKFIARI